MITPDTIGTYTGGSITVGETITQDQFELYLVQAEAQIAMDAPTLQGVMRDEAITLLICCRADTANDKAGVISEKIGADYSYTKASGKSPYCVMYQQLLNAHGKSMLTGANAEITHSDAGNRKAIFTDTPPSTF
jgi:hypothetical protein